MNQADAEVPPILPLLRKVAQFVSPYRKRIGAILCLALCASALSAAEPLALKYVFDELASGGASRALVYGVLAFFGLLLLREALNGVLDTRIWDVRIGVHYRITRATVERLHSLPLSFHRSESVGAIMTKMDRGINGFAAAFSDVAFYVVPAVVYLAMAVTVMFRLEPRLALAIVLLAPVAPAIGAHAAKEQADRERTLIVRWTRIFSRFNEVLSGIAVVKSFAMEESEKRRFLGGVEQANAVVLRGVRTDARVTAAKNSATTIARVVALALGGAFVLHHQMTVGTLVAFLGYVGAMLGPVQGLTGAYQTFRKGTVALETIFSILDADDSLGDAKHAKDAGALSGAVEFKNLSFAYRDDAPILKAISLSIKPGETIALVGPSGSGKSTLMKLLQRLYDPTDGAILVDGKDIRDLTQRSLRLQIGVVMQEPALFSDSIRENIAFGRPNASSDEIQAAARDANAHDFISALPDGYATKLGERGCRVSAGQAQRISIARAILKNPPILILDEATSALDAESEHAVQQALRRLKEGRTTFVIAHRLSTVVDADRIVVLKDGKIVEIGTHRDLVERSGDYASLVRRQALFVPDVPDVPSTDDLDDAAA